jgi:ABC-type transport system involved in cytochrome bd biosynthesis fused ATPase/permease subunit
MDLSTWIEALRAQVAAVDPILLIALGVALLALVILTAWASRRRAKRTKRLKTQFKSEYDRTVDERRRRKAEEELERRMERRQEVDLIELDEAEAEDIHDQMADLQRTFVDGPESSARGMTQLVGRIAISRGYVATDEGLLDLVSVDHPEQVAALRRALSLMDQVKGLARTEASRQVFQDAKILAERLLAEGLAGSLPDEDRTSSTVTVVDPADDPGPRVPAPFTAHGRRQPLATNGS